MLIDEASSTSKKCDIFSLGASFLEIAGNVELPSNGPMWHKVREGNIKFAAESHRSEELENLINWMMEVNPSERPSIDEVLNCPQFIKIINEHMIDIHLNLKQNHRNNLSIRKPTNAETVLVKIY